MLSHCLVGLVSYCSNASGTKWYVDDSPHLVKNIFFLALSFFLHVKQKNKQFQFFTQGHTCVNRKTEIFFLVLFFFVFVKQKYKQFSKKSKKNFSFHAGAHLRKPTQGHTCVNCKTDFKRIFFFKKKWHLPNQKDTLEVAKFFNCPIEQGKNIFF